jgi:hypothetical protein
MIVNNKNMSTGVLALVVIAVVVLIIVFSMRNQYSCNNELDGSGAYLTDVKNTENVSCSDPIGKPVSTLAAAIKACDKNSACKQVVSVKVGKTFRYQMCGAEPEGCGEQCCSNCNCPEDCHATLSSSSANYVKTGAISTCTPIMEKKKAIVSTTFSAAMAKMNTYNANRDKIIKANLKLPAKKKKTVPVACVSITSRPNAAKTGYEYVLCSGPAKVQSCKSDQICQNDCTACNLSCSSPECMGQSVYAGDLVLTNNTVEDVVTFVEAPTDDTFSAEIPDAENLFSQTPSAIPTNLHIFGPPPAPVQFFSPITNETLTTPSVTLAAAKYRYQTPVYTTTTYTRPDYVPRAPTNNLEFICGRVPGVPEDKVNGELFYTLSVPTNSKFTFSSTLNPDTNMHEINLKEKLAPLIYANAVDTNAQIKWNVLTRLVITNTTHLNDPKNVLNMSVKCIKDTAAIVPAKLSKLNLDENPRYFIEQFFNTNVTDDHPACTSMDSSIYNPKNTTTTWRVGMFYMLLNDTYKFLQLKFINQTLNVPFTLTVTLGTLLSEPGYLQALQPDWEVGILSKHDSGVSMSLTHTDATTVALMGSVSCY